MSKFKFELKDQVTITTSGETGEVIARAEYINGHNTYRLRYLAATGVATERWWSEEALTA